MPFYREVLEGHPDAAILALQEVGPRQAAALARAARRGLFALVRLSRPGQGNALVVPRRFAVERARRAFFLRAQATEAARAARAWRRERRPADWRQLGELRMWIEARLRDERAGRALTVLTTHLSLAPALKLAQARAVVARALAASAYGPVVLAGDLNVPADARGGTDGEIAALLRRRFDDMGTAAPPPGRPNIDHVLALGFAPVSSRLWTGPSLSLPGQPDAEHVSDHYAEDDVLRYT